MNPTEITACARTVEDAVRRLTHLTLAAHNDIRRGQHRADETMTPADIDVVLSHLAETVAGLPQVATHVAGLLEDTRRSYDLFMDSMTHTTDPDRAIDTAAFHLDALRYPADLVYRRLNAARQETAHIRATPVSDSPAPASCSVRRPRPESPAPGTRELGSSGLIR